MNEVFIVATAKYPVILRGVHYKIGDTIPTVLTEKEYEFYKHALNVESVNEVKAENNSYIVTNQNTDKDKLAIKTEEVKTLEKTLNQAIQEISELKAKIAELESKLGKPVTTGSVAETTETEVKPKRPYAKKETK